VLFVLPTITRYVCFCCIYGIGVIAVLLNMWCLVFNDTFSNISAISSSWRPVLEVEEAGVPGENYPP
jgi:hypothetical protein